MSTNKCYRNWLCNVSAYNSYVVKRRENDIADCVLIILRHFIKWSLSPFGDASVFDVYKSNNK